MAVNYEEIQQKLRERVKALLEAGTISCFVGWEAGRFQNQTTPLIVSDASQANRLVYNQYCVNTLAKYALDLKTRGTVGMAVRGCDSRGINRLINDNQLARDQVYLIGLPCAGARARATGEPLEKCTNCAHRNPVVYDELLGSPAEEQPPADRFAQANAVEAMSIEQRRAFFDQMFSKCLRCYACRNVCPCCSCRVCFVDSRRVAWQGKQANLNENRFYGLTRAFHVADRCIECGECERVCPVDLPLMALNKKLVKDMVGLFGNYESGLTSENPDVLINYDLTDLEEFM